MYIAMAWMCGIFSIRPTPGFTSTPAHVEQALLGQRRAIPSGAQWLSRNVVTMIRHRDSSVQSVQTSSTLDNMADQSEGPRRGDAGKGRVEPMYLDKPTAAAFLSVSVSTFEKLLREDASFPRPRAISAHRNGYLLAELREWCQARPEARRLPPPNTARRRARGLSITSRAPPDAH